MKEAERQLSDEKICEENRITGKDQAELVEKSNNLFSNLRKKNVITENEQVTWTTSHFELWNPYRKSLRILGSPFTAYNEKRRVLYKRQRIAKLKAV